MHVLALSQAVSVRTRAKHHAHLFATCHLSQGTWDGRRRLTSAKLIVPAQACMCSLGLQLLAAVKYRQHKQLPPKSPCCGRTPPGARARQCWVVSMNCCGSTAGN